MTKNYNCLYLVDNQTYKSLTSSSSPSIINTASNVIEHQSHQPTPAIDNLGIQSARNMSSFAQNRHGNHRPEINKAEEISLNDTDAVSDQVFHRDVDAVMEDIPATSGLSPAESKNMSVQVYKPSSAVDDHGTVAPPAGVSIPGPVAPPPRIHIPAKRDLFAKKTNYHLDKKKNQNKMISDGRSARDSRTLATTSRMPPPPSVTNSALPMDHTATISTCPPSTSSGVQIETGADKAVKPMHKISNFDTGKKVVKYLTPKPKKKTSSREYKTNSFLDWEQLQKSGFAKIRKPKRMSDDDYIENGAKRRKMQ